jgi:hypothetical protein
MKNDDHGMLRIPCIVCGVALDNLDEDGNQPSLGVEFTTYGHYGSTVFDPMDGTAVAVNVCDDCLTHAKNEGRVLFVDGRAVPPQPKQKYSVWK